MSIGFVCKRMMATVFLVSTSVVCFAVAGSVFAASEPAPQGAQAPATEAWQKEFDHVCSRTQEAMSFSEQELVALIQRCDVLLPKIEKLDETRKKVYVGRLKMCRGLYAYVLESKRNENK
jgi:hypothetical protein